MYLIYQGTIICVF